MDDDDSPPPSYRHNPRPVGYPIFLKIEGGRLVVDTTRKVETVELGAVTRIRLTYEPRSFAQSAYKARLSLANGGRVSITSVSWNSLMDVRQQDAEYSAFMRALVAAVAGANPDVELLRGKAAPLWYATIVAAAVALVGVALFAWRAFTGGAPAAGGLGVAVALVGIWQLEPMIRLNRPGRFTPAAPPDELLPKGPAA